MIDGSLDQRPIGDSRLLPGFSGFRLWLTHSFQDVTYACRSMTTNNVVIVTLDSSAAG